MQKKCFRGTFAIHLHIDASGKAPRGSVKTFKVIFEKFFEVWEFQLPVVVAVFRFLRISRGDGNAAIVVSVWMGECNPNALIV